MHVTCASHYGRVPTDPETRFYATPQPATCEEFDTAMVFLLENFAPVPEMSGTPRAEDVSGVELHVPYL